MYSVAFEGLDGAGKSTLIELVERDLQNAWPVRRQKLGPLVLAKFRAFAQQTLGNGDRYEDLFDTGFRNRLYVTEGAIDDVYRRAHPTDEIVLRDRWIDTLRAYSDLVLDDAGGRVFAQRVDHSDLTFYLDVSVDTALQRLVQSEDWLVKRLGVSDTASLLRRLSDKYSGIYAAKDAAVRLDAEASPETSRSKVLQVIQARGPRAERLSPASPAPADVKRVAIEGIDGSGKSTLVNELASWMGKACGARTFAEASRDIFKAAVGGGPDASSRLRQSFSSSLRQQSYAIDALVQLKTDLPGSPRVQIFDRWMPAFNRMRGEIAQHAEFFDYLVDGLPQPDLLVVLDIDPSVAADRLVARSDWMIAQHGREKSVELLTAMRAAPLRLSGVPTCYVDATQPPGRVLAEVQEFVKAHGIH